MPPPESTEPEEELPPGWRKWWSERRKKHYYHHEETGEVQWDTPKWPKPPQDTIPEEASKQDEPLEVPVPHIAGGGAAAATVLQPTPRSSSAPSTEQPESHSPAPDRRTDDASQRATSAGAVDDGARVEDGDPTRPQEDKLPPPTSAAAGGGEVPPMSPTMTPLKTPLPGAKTTTGDGGGGGGSGGAEPHALKLESKLADHESSDYSLTAEPIDTLSPLAALPPVVGPPLGIGEFELGAAALPFDDASSLDGGDSLDGGGVDDSETVDYLQKLIPYFNHDDTTSSLVKQTISLVPDRLIDSTDANGSTLLLLAVQYRAHDAVGMILKAGANPNGTNREGSCALHYACARDTLNIDTVRLLLEFGADPAVKEEWNAGGLTPLHYAAQTGHMELCKLLIENGADPDQLDDYQRTPCDLALEAGQVECAEWWSTVSTIMASPHKVRQRRQHMQSTALQATGDATSTSASASEENKQAAAFAVRMLEQAQEELSRTQTLKEQQRQEYETQLREKDVELNQALMSTARFDADKRNQQLKLEQALSDQSGLETRIAELQARLASVEAQAEEEKRGQVELQGRLDRRLVDVEGLLAAERSKLDHEREVTQETHREMRKEREKLSRAMQEQSTMARETAQARTRLAQKEEELKRTTADLARLQQDFAAQRESLDKARSSNDAAQLDLMDARAASTREQERCVDLQHRLDDARKAVQAEQDLRRLLTDGMDDLKSTSAAMRSELRALQEELAGTRSSHDNSRGREQRLEDELSEERSRFSKLESSLHTHKLEAAEHKAEVKRLQHLAELAERTEADLRRRVDEHSEDLRRERQAKDELASSERLASTGQHALKTRVAELEHAEAEAVGLRAKVSELETAAKQLQASERDLRDSAAEQRTKAEQEHKQQLDGLLVQLGAANQRIAELSDKDRERAIDETKRVGELTLKEDALCQAQEQLASLRQRVADADRQISEAHERERQLSSEVQQLAAQRADAQASDEQNASVLLVQLLEAQQRNDALQQQDKANATRVHELELELQRSKTSASTSTVERDAAMRRAADADAAVDAANAKLNEATALAAQLRNESNSTKAGAEAAAKEVADLRKQLVQGEQARASALQDAATAAEQQRAAATAARRDAEDQIAQLTSTNTRLFEEVQAAKREAQAAEENARAKAAEEMEAAKAQALESKLKIIEQERRESEEESKKIVGELLEEVSKLKSQLDVARRNAQADSESSSGRVAELTSQVQQLRNALSEAEAGKQSASDKMLRELDNAKQQQQQLKDHFATQMQALRDAMSKSRQEAQQAKRQLSQVSKEGKSASESLQVSLQEAEQRLVDEVKIARDSERQAAQADFEQQLQFARENLRLEALETQRKLEGQMERTKQQAADQVASAKAAAAQEHSRNKALEVQLSQAVEQVQAESRRLERQFESEKEALTDQHGREVKNLQGKLDDQQAQADSTIHALEEQVRQGTSALEELQTKSDEEIQRLSEEVRRNALARHKSEQNLLEMRDFVDRAKAIDSRNAILDRDMRREIERRRKLHAYVEDLKGRIRVYVRVRPMSNGETERGSEISYVKNSNSSVTYLQPDKNPPEDRKNFDFDKIFEGGPEANAQSHVFEDVKQLVLSCVEGVNVCIFAYGQTGSGKTFTMVGADGSIGSNIDPETQAPMPMAGVTPRAAVEIFQVLEERDALCEAEVDVSMYELYCDALVDLLREPSRGGPNGSAPPLNIRLAEHTSSGLVEVENGVIRQAKSLQELIEILDFGVNHRSTHSTKMNAASSRSHLVMTFVIRSINRRSGAVVQGKLTLVDLAGSERVDKSGAEGQRLKEAASINKSLSAIGDVVGALTQNTKHIPYRNHALTTLMSDSIGGNAKTVMMVCCSPANYNTTESVSSLSFAQRCKNVRTMTNTTAAQAAQQVKSLRQELARLKKGGAQPAAAPANHGKARKR